MTPTELAERLGRLLKRDARVLALFVTGSLARGDADEYSDLDLILIAQPEHHESLAALCRGYLQQCQEVVYWKPGGDPPQLHAITAEWLRCDFAILTPAAARLRARAGLAVIWDRARISETLLATPATDAERAARIAAIIDEFIRLLGLLEVVLGRGEALLGVQHAQRLREQLVALLLEADAAPGRRAALRLDSCLSAESQALLGALPEAVPELASVRDAHIACARIFLPRARSLTESLGIRWPEPFVTATQRVWDRLGLHLA
jgi:predicted nucleotidyltransferase